MKRFSYLLALAMTAGCAGGPQSSGVPQAPLSAQRSGLFASEQSASAPQPTSQGAADSEASNQSEVSDQGQESNSADPNARARLHPIVNSGIRAQIRFQRDKSILRVSGFASGMDPSRAYYSFIYGTGSLASGPQAGQCLPPTPNNLSLAQMMLGYWLPMGSSIRSLQVAKSGAAFAALKNIGTTSVRWDTMPGQPVVANPARFVLQACGKVRRIGERDRHEENQHD